MQTAFHRLPGVQRIIAILAVVPLSKTVAAPNRRDRLSEPVLRSPARQFRCRSPGLTVEDPQ